MLRHILPGVLLRKRNGVLSSTTDRESSPPTLATPTSSPKKTRLDRFKTLPISPVKSWLPRCRTLSTNTHIIHVVPAEASKDFESKQSDHFFSPGHLRIGLRSSLARLGLASRSPAPSSSTIEELPELVASDNATSPPSAGQSRAAQTPQQTIEDIAVRHSHEHHSQYAIYGTVDSANGSYPNKQQDPPPPAFFDLPREVIEQINNDGTSIAANHGSHRSKEELVPAAIPPHTVEWPFSEEVSQHDDSLRAEKQQNTQSKYDGFTILLDKTRGIKYKLVKTLGKGGYGYVYMASLISSNAGDEYVAIKTFPMADLREYSSYRRSLEREVEVLRKATERNYMFLARMNSVFVEEEYDCVCIVMPLYGGDLASHIERPRRMPLQEIKLIFAELVVGMESIHTLGYLHRDIKPANIFLSPSGHAILGDFSISVKPRYTPFQTFFDGIMNGLAGTPMRFAPEMYAEGREYGWKADVWGLGLTVLDMYLGSDKAFFQPKKVWKTYSNGEKLEVSDEGKYEILYKDIRQTVMERVDGEDGRALLLKLLNRNPAHRPTIAEIKADRYFADFDWDRVAAGSYTPIYRPSRPGEDEEEEDPPFILRGHDEEVTRLEFEEGMFRDVDIDSQESESAVLGRWSPDGEPLWAVPFPRDPGSEDAL